MQSERRCRERSRDALAEGNTQRNVPLTGSMKSGLRWIRLSRQPQAETSTSVAKSQSGRHFGLPGCPQRLDRTGYGCVSAIAARSMSASVPPPPLADNSPRLRSLLHHYASPSTKNASIDVMGTIDAMRSAMVRGEASSNWPCAAGEDNAPMSGALPTELVQRERARDSALGLARACEKAGDVPCVLRSAGDALASDVSDSEARGMLLRAVTQTGATQVTAVKVNQRGDPSIATHRPAPEKRRIRRAPQIFANDTDIYGKH